VKVLLAIPTAGNPAAPFLASLRDLRLPESMTAFDRITIVGNFVPGQRELAARRALRVGADVLIMVDDDMIVPPDALQALIDALEGDPHLAVVGALYYARDGLRPIVADHWSSHDTTTASIPAYGDTLTYCDVVGFGCAALRVSALRSMPPPYFRTQVYVEELASRVRICNEDYLFCEDVRRAGWRVALHAGVRCKHHDRASGTDYPREWEDPSITAVERMIVADPGPSYRLIPYDPTLATSVERHEKTSIDYIIVD
jgi:GT2 family glycosyltransferase